MTIDRTRLERFVFHEARLMDEHRYDEWLTLWAQDARYWVPAGAEDSDPSKDVSLIYDDYVRLQGRISRLKSGVAYAQSPRSRLCRVISNFEFDETPAGEVVVRSNFLLAEQRLGKQDLFAGSTTHHLRPSEEGFKIASKKVILINSDAFIDNLTFLL
ncbi:MAG TPA: aromatic-ring-hydroxylating dioxygenase subunit beta [Candidatus Binataceae bacterium]|nr:aromatic-ring-hydroxylating dioxygenase subunit beta [Candidatus Binataceae bacterium]